VEEGADDLQVLPPGEKFVDRGALPSDTDAGPHPGRLADHVEAGHRRSPGVGRQQGGQDPQQRRLTGAVATQEGATEAVPTVRSTPRNAWVPLNALVRFSASIANPVMSRLPTALLRTS